MHGLIIRSFQSFVQTTYGPSLWEQALVDVDAPAEDFEPMLRYPDELAQSILHRLVALLGKPRETLLEDWGTFLIAGKQFEIVRRLLRFGGSDFEEFLASLDGLAGRVRLAMPDLALPDMDVKECEPGVFRVSWNAFGHPGISPILQGLLRALADDYGALVFISPDQEDANSALLVRLLEAEYAEGRKFALAK